MKTIHVDQIIEGVSRACHSLNVDLPDDVVDSLTTAAEVERSPIGRQIIAALLENADLAKAEQLPICQDSGMVVAFVSLGQNVQIVGGDLSAAINSAVRRAYCESFFRKSVVADPLRRDNTGDNTPVIIHYDVVAGDRLTIDLAAKGFGSENMSRSKMLKPSDGVDGVVQFVEETVALAGGNPCPPIVIGIGLGGTLEKAALLAKKALLRDVSSRHPDAFYSDLEQRILARVNRLGIGPQGLGGSTTALAVHIEYFATHIAGLPVVVNINCHASRHAQVVL